MTETVRMVSTSDHEYGGKPLRKGDRFSAEVGHQALLEALGRAELQGKAGRERRPKAEAAKQALSTTPALYRTRDMVAGKPAGRTSTKKPAARPRARAKPRSS